VSRYELRTLETVMTTLLAALLIWIVALPLAVLLCAALLARLVKGRFGPPADPAALMPPRRRRLGMGLGKGRPSPRPRDADPSPPLSR
jgi:hypothetical protein